MTDAQYNIKKLEEKIEKQKALIKELLNELCLRCGNYKNEKVLDIKENREPNNFGLYKYLIFFLIISCSILDKKEIPFLFIVLLFKSQIT